MSHPMMNAAVAESMVENLKREISSPEGQQRARLVYERQVRRASRRAYLRNRLARFWHRRSRVAEHELAA